MKEVAKQHKIANPDMQVFVTNYLPRPTLKLRDKKGPMSTFTFCEAMQRFSHHLSVDFLTATARFANVHIPREDLAPTFLLLSADLLRSANLTPNSPSEGPPPPTSRGTPLSGQVSPSPGTSSSRLSTNSKKRRAANPRPVFPKRGRSVRLPPSFPASFKGKGRGKRSQVQPLTEAMEVPTSGDEEQAEPESIVPIDFSKEAED